MFISPSFTRMVQAADKASLLTASGMLLHAFPSMSVSSLRGFPKKLCLQTWWIQLFYKIFAQKKYQFLSYDIESA